MDNEEEVPEPEMKEETLEFQSDDGEEVMSLSVANQRYLQENFRGKTVEELSVATMLPPHLVAEYLELFEVEARKKGIDPNQHFSLSVTLNEDNNVGFGIQFPREEELEKSIDGIGHLLFALNEGTLKAHLVQFLHHFAEQRKAYDLVHKILKVWSDLVTEKNGTNKPIVRPDEVLK